MARILMRGYADPFVPLTPLDAIRKKQIGQNSGNLVFVAAVLRNLLLEDTEVDFISFSSDVSSQAAIINERYDRLVMPFANAFRPGFAASLDRHSAVIEKLTIPVTIVGIGAQATLDYDWSRLDSIAPSVKRFVGTVLDHGPSIGVRGDLTCAYLKSLGFSDVQTIGCPSMYMQGSELTVDVPETLTAESRIALNLTPRVPMPAKFCTKVLQAFPDTTYIAQDQADLEMMLGGASVDGQSDYPGSFANPYLQQDRMLMYLNAQRWIRDMAGYDFAFGSRIHGNVAAILAGTPGHVIAHDSRTRELAEYFEIPWTRGDAITDETTALSLFEASDWSSMVNGHCRRFERFVNFLGAHGIQHIHRDDAAGSKETEFDRRTRESAIGDEVKVGVTTAHPSHLAARDFINSAYTQKASADTYKRVSKVVGRIKTSVAAEAEQRETDIAELRNEIAKLGAENAELRAVIMGRDLSALEQDATGPRGAVARVIRRLKPK